MNTDSLNIKGRTFIIAEIGVNHEGSFEKAIEMIDLAAGAGADAVKFQTYIPEKYISASQPERLERVRRFALNFNQFRQLAIHAKEVGIHFISTPLDFNSLDLLAELCDIIKISSGDITYYPLLERAAKTGKMLIVSTGLATLEETEKAVKVIESGNPAIRRDKKIALLHCLAAYPAPEEEINLRSIPFLEDHFGLPIGYSDHTEDILASLTAVALGAPIIEKHFTYRKENQTFHDHAKNCFFCAGS